MPFNVQIQRYTRLLQKKLGLLGYVPLNLVEDIQPGINIVTGEAPEDYFLREEDRFAMSATMTPVAGQFAFLSLDVPAGANCLAIIERIHITGAAGAQAYALIGTSAAVTAGGAAYPLDMRRGFGAVQSRANVNQGANAAIPGMPLLYFNTIALTDRDVIPEEHLTCVIAPGSRVAVYNRTANQGMQATFWWREYVPAPQELTSG